MGVVSFEVAEKEVNAWMDYRKVGHSKREKLKGSIDKMIEAIMDGNMVIDDETKEITHNLMFPFGDQVKISELKYKPRVAVENFQDHMKGVADDDAFGRVFAYMAGISGQSKNVIKKMDHEDYAIASAVAVFFMI